MNVAELDQPLDPGAGARALVPGVLGHLVADLPDALEAGEGLGDLAADGDDLDDGTDEQSQVEGEGEEGADRHPPGQNVVRPDPHDRDADDAQEQRRERGDGRKAGHRPGDVAEEPVDPLGEDQGLAPLGAVGLDHPHARERLGQAAGDLGVDLGALAEERPQRLERVEENQAEERQDGERDQRELRVQIEEDAEGEDRRDQAAEDLDEAGAHEVADALGVGHDPGEQGAGLGLVEIGDGEPAHVPLDACGASP